MSTSQPDFSALASAVQEAQSVVLFVHPQATYDALAAALTLRLAFQAKGKQAAVVCEEPLRVEHSALIGVDSVATEPGNKDLVISFPFENDQIEKVSYNMDEANKKFDLIVTPKPGQPHLDTSRMEFRKAGLSTDLTLLFGYHSFAELGAVYEQEQNAIASSYTVAITQSEIPTFAAMHLQLQPDQLTYSELAFFLIKQLQIAEVDAEMATNSLAGIEYGTERFQSQTLNPRTFETVAELIRLGGTRNPDNPAFENLQAPIRRNPAMTTSQIQHPSTGSFPVSGEVVEEDDLPQPLASGKATSTDLARVLRQKRSQAGSQA